MNIIAWKDLKDNSFTKAIKNVLLSWDLGPLSSSKVITLSYAMLLHSLRRPRPSGHPTEHHKDEFIHDIRLIRPDKEEVTSSLGDLVKDIHFKEQEIKAMNILELAISVNYFGIQ